MRRKIYLPLSCLVVMVLMTPGPALSSPAPGLSATHALTPDGVTSWIGQVHEGLKLWLTSVTLHASNEDVADGSLRVTTAQSELQDDSTDTLRATDCELETCSDLGPQVDPDG